MDDIRGLDELCRQHNLDLKQLAEKSGLDHKRLQAIVEGRWTPSPAERDRIAALFGLTREQIAWGHRNPVAHVYGHGPQFGRSP
jgi:transcriptional regulator with XRE-family HTH domain